MKRQTNFSIISALILAASILAAAQKIPDAGNKNNETTLSAEDRVNSGDFDYKTPRGTNEFGVWTGGSWQATAAFGGLHKDETRGRKFFLAAIRYGRTLAAPKNLALQYTLDIIPFAAETGNISRASSSGSFYRETSYGYGLTPLGLQLDFKNSSRIKPFVHINAGMMLFNNPVPLPDAGKFAFTLIGGGGIRIFYSSKKSLMLGLRFHHISNGNLSGGSNRGLNQFTVSLGLSVFKKPRNR